MLVFYEGWLLPLIYAVGFALTFGFKNASETGDQRQQPHWRIARITSALGLLGVVLSIGSALFAYYANSTVSDALGLTVALLVALLGWIVTRYSVRYLSGEPHQAAYVRHLLLTITCVGVLVTSGNLLVMVLAWGATSIGLHQLLTFYPERKAAQVVAHKKFIACRLADACLIVALLLVFSATGSFSLASIETITAATANASQSLPATLQAAMVLIALAAIIRTAQLPLHGWLIQVMEAPTPVSALLHAGVVNMGGFVLIRLASWLSVTPLAQTILVLVGSLTAALAGLVMMTRVSVKVRLAWSTCAQMGFMLMEIGLGLYELALLHLLAHSLYKSYAFLASGDRVAQASQQDLLGKLTGPQKPRQSAIKHPMLWYAGSVLASAAIIGVALEFWALFFTPIHFSVTAFAILSLGFAPLLWFEGARSVGSIGRGVMGILSLTLLYLTWHVAFSTLAPAPINAALWLTGWAVLCIAALYAIQTWLRAYPEGRLAARLYPWAYCGFYLDELFTRLTFKIWPIRLSPIQAQTRVHRKSSHLGGAL